MSRMGRYIVDSMERFGYVKPLPKPEECPYLKKRPAGDEVYYWCDLSDHPCEREYNDSVCEEYNDFLKEVDNE